MTPRTLVKRRGRYFALVGPVADRAYLWVVRDRDRIIIHGLDTSFSRAARSALAILKAILPPAGVDTAVGGPGGGFSP